MEFPFEILDKMSGPLSKMDKELQKIEKDIKGVDKQIKDLEKHMALQSLAKEKDPLKQQLGFLKLNRDAWRGMATEMREASQSKAAGSMLGQLKGLGAALGPWAQIGGFVLDLGKAAIEAGEKVFELGAAFVHAAVEEANFRAVTTRTLEAMLGSRKAAEESFAAIAGAAESTSMTRKELAALYEDLLAFRDEGGLTEKNVQDIIAASMDVGAIQGRSAQDALLEVVKHAQASGSFDERAMHGLRGIAAATPQKFIQYLAEQHHTSTDQIKAMLKAGQISAAEGTKALLDLVQKNVDKGGALGSTAGSISKSDIFVQLKNLKERVSSLFGGIDMAPLNRALEYVSKLLDPAGPKFKRLQTIIEGTFDKIAQFVDRVVESGAVEDIIDAITDAFNILEQVDLNSLVGDVQDLASGVKLLFGSNDDQKAFAEGLTLVAKISLDAILAGLGMLTATVKALVAYRDAILQMADALSRMLGMGGIHVQKMMSKQSIGGEAAGSPGGNASAAATPSPVVAPPDNSAVAHAHGKNTGFNFAQGLAAGIQDGGGDARAAATALGDTTVNATRNRLGIHSPSDVMMELGAYTAQGFQVGLDSVTPPSFDFTPSIKAPGGAAGHSIQVGDIVVHVEGGGHDAASMGQEIARAVRAEIIRFTDGLAFEA